MLDLQEYLSIAKKLIHKYGCKEMLKDEDAIGYVANAIMTADTKYDNITGSIEGFRYSYGRYSIMNWYNRHIKTRPKNVVSLSDKDFIMGNVSHDIEMSEINDFIKTMPTKLQQVIQMYYFDRKTLEEIGKELNITREGVRVRLKAAIARLKDKFND